MGAGGAYSPRVGGQAPGQQAVLIAGQGLQPVLNDAQGQNVLGMFPAELKREALREGAGPHPGGVQRLDQAQPLLQRGLGQPGGLCEFLQGLVQPAAAVQALGDKDGGRPHIGLQVHALKLEEQVAVKRVLSVLRHAEGV